MTTAEILAKLPSMRALVVGDVCLDRWCRYDPSLSEPSRETGIARVAVTHVESTPGAAGTIAANLASLGVGQVSVLGALGDDGFGFELERSLAARSIATDLIVRSPLIATFTYTKLLNASSDIEDLPRVDFINAVPLPDAVETELLDRVREHAEHFDVILVSDQAEIAAGGNVTAKIRKVLEHIGKIVWVDSRSRCELFRNVILKPNRAEADAALARIGASDYAILREYTKSKLLIVTDGAEGSRIFDERGQSHVPARRVESPIDICGAGDSFSAGAAMALAITGSPIEAAEFGNLVASLTINKRGTGTASPDELLASSL
jgi:rfaE bifunctional protein kinase chain/domain